MLSPALIEAMIAEPAANARAIGAGKPNVSATRRILKTGSYDYGVTQTRSPPLAIRSSAVKCPDTIGAASDQSVERRNSGALCGFAGSDLTGSILVLSTRGVSTRADTSTEPVRSGGCSERGRAAARAIIICAAP
jgi:hypothetical protein